MKTIRKSGEDYLETIYNLLGDGQSVRSVVVAKALGVSKPSAFNAFKVLAEEGYIVKEPYGAVSLTVKGVQYARAIQKKHKAIRMLLIDVLKVSAAVAERDACKIEHCLSEETTDRLFEFLKLN